MELDVGLELNLEERIDVVVPIVRQPLSRGSLLERRHAIESIDFSDLATLGLEHGASLPKTPSLARTARVQSARSAQHPQLTIQQWRSQANMVDRGVRKANSASLEGSREKYNSASWIPASEIQTLDAFLMPQQYKTTLIGNLPPIPEECEYMSDANADDSISCVLGCSHLSASSSDVSME